MNLDKIGSRYFCVNHDQALEAEYDRLSENVKSASELRNNIAHGAVQQFAIIPAEAEDTVKIKPVKAFLLAPAYYNARKLILHSDDKGSFSIGYFHSQFTLNEYGENFRDLAKRTKSYHQKIWARIEAFAHKPVLLSR